MKPELLTLHVLRVLAQAQLEDTTMNLDALASALRVRRRDVPRLVAAITLGRPYGRNVLTGLDLDRIVVRCDRPLPLQADGEDLGDVEYAVFEAHRDAVAVLV